ncbi:hypothetical protein ABIE02_002648 [Leclercia sp. 1548]
MCGGSLRTIMRDRFVPKADGHSVSSKYRIAPNDLKSYKKHKKIVLRGFNEPAAIYFICT